MSRSSARDKQHSGYFRRNDRSSTRSSSSSKASTNRDRMRCFKYKVPLHNNINAFRGSSNKLHNNICAYKIKCNEMK